jgi:hypothetical protein
MAREFCDAAIAFSISSLRRLLASAILDHHIHSVLDRRPYDVIHALPASLAPYVGEDLPVGFGM